MTPRKLDRRQALTMGAAGVGAVLLNACGGSGKKGASSPTAPEPSAPLSAAPSGALAAADFGSAGTCAVIPAQIDGPYYLDVDKLRSDIREDRPGMRLRVAARVVDRDGCTPIKDAVFEIWHCDASGVYSGFESVSRGGPLVDRDDTRYLRGAQLTNGDGIAEITTIYPGWYPGRTPHIHAKVFVSNNEELSTQFYFDESVNAAVLKTAPYNERDDRDAFNNNDGFYADSNTLTMRTDGDGYVGLVTIAVSA